MGHCHTLPAIMTATAAPGIPMSWVIVGPANSGKSVLFNGLTGAYSIVANYPQTTVAPTCQTFELDGVSLRLIDTPGIGNLTVHTPDERATLEQLVREPSGGILFCGDAMRLQRSLVLLAQLLELERPVLCCLNKSDESASNGMVIDCALLSRQLGIPVMEVAAVHEFGFDLLRERIQEAMQPDGPAIFTPQLIQYPTVVEEALIRLGSLFPLEQRPSRGVSLLFLQGDESATRWFVATLGEAMAAEAQQIIRETHFQAPPSRIRLALFRAREAWANRLTKQVLHQAACIVPGWAQRAAWAARHPILGWPIFLVILWLTFKGVGLGAAEVGGWLDETFFAPAAQAIGSLAPHPLIYDFLVGPFGILTMGVSNAMVTVVPILVVFFLIVNFLEDVGYLPNLSVLANRSLKPLGLTGKAVLPLVLGTGCNTTATITSRILETRKERLLVSFLVALGVPCSVQMGVLMAILATMPFSALLIVMGSVIGTTLVCGLAMNRLLPAREGATDFILELPSFHWPHWRNILRKTYFRIKWFLAEALPMFVMAAFLMFAMEKTGLLELIKKLLHPLVTDFLSLPDKVTEVFILVLSRREVGAVYFKQMVEAGELDYTQIVTGLVVITLFIPCISNTMVMIKEFGARWAITTNLAIIGLAILMGGAVNALLRMP